MKLVMVIFVVIFFILPVAKSESFESQIFNSDSVRLENLKTSVEISQQGVLYAKILVRQVKSHGARCDFTASASSNRGCNIERFDVYIPNMIEDNGIVYYVSGSKNIVCGYVHDSFGKEMVELYDNCYLRKFEVNGQNKVVFRVND